jgi:hypothetical protein
VLQGTTDRLIETGRCYGMEMNVEKTNVMKTSKQPFPIHIRIHKKQPKNVEYFICLGSTLTNDATDTREIISRIAMVKAAFNKKKNIFSSKLNLNLGNKLIKCYIWSRAFYGVETRTLRTVDQKYMGSFEIWCWRRMENSCTDSVSNEEVLHRVKEETNILETTKERRLTGQVTSCVGTAF